MCIRDRIYSESHRFPELGAAAAERTALGIARISDFVRNCARNAGRSCSDPRGIAEAFIFMIRGWYVNVILTNRDVPAAERESWVKPVSYTHLTLPTDDLRVIPVIAGSLKKKTT